MCSNSSVFLLVSASDEIQHLSHLMRMCINEHGGALIDIRPSNVICSGRTDERRSSKQDAQWP